MKYTDEFSKDMGKIFSLVNGECGGESIQSTMFGWLDGDIDVSADNEDEWVETFKNSDRGLFHVLYALVNYDLVSITYKKVNVAQSNHPDIAKVIKKWVKPEVIEKVYSQF